ncbi:transposase [Chryseobacterium nematophagum]
MLKKENTKVENRNTFSYFDNRSTNAPAESFNAKIKNFRLQGVKDRTFFLLRLSKPFA